MSFRWGSLTRGWRRELVQPVRFRRSHQARQKHGVRPRKRSWRAGVHRNVDAPQFIARFKIAQKCPEVLKLLASTRVASEGLTLTEANHVIFINRWWNPSSNAQARDRVVRIGQSKSVSVISFTCRGTVEERLDGLLKEKALTFDELIEALSKSTDEAEELFRRS